MAAIRNTSILPESLIVIPSPLLFYGVELLLETMPHNCHVICLEADQQLMAFSLKYAPHGLTHHTKISVLRTKDSSQLLKAIECLGSHPYRRVVNLPLTGGYHLYKDTYDELVRAAESYIQQQWQNKITLMHMGRMWVKNLFSNLSRYWQDLSRPYIQPEKPILVVGAGESLEHALSLMERFRGRYYLLAVDTALPTLTAAGITPDAVVVLEAQLANALDFLGHGNHELCLICDLTSHPSTLGATNCKRHFILSEFADCGLVDRLNKSALNPRRVQPLGSVGIVAVDLALDASPGPVMLVGLDFNYVLGKPHARGAPSHLLSLCSTHRTRPPGWYAESMSRPLILCTDKRQTPLYSDLVLRSYGDNLAQALAGNKRVYDLRTCGIPLEIPSLRTYPQMEKMLGDFERQTTASPLGRQETREKPPDRTMVLSFLEREQHLLREFLANYRFAGQNREGLAESLKKVDYVYLDFPDTERSQSEADDFLLRCAASASFYLEHLDRVTQATRWS